MRNVTQVFLKFRNSILEICLHLINLNCTLDFLTSMMLSSGAGTSNEIPLQESGLALPAILIILPFLFFEISCTIKKYSTYFSYFDMSSNISLDSTDSDVFYVEHISNEPRPQRIISPDILYSTELSEHHVTRMPSISTIVSPQPYIFTINDDYNEPTIPYRFGRQLPIVPPSLKDLNLPPNSFNILATMAITNNNECTNDDNYSPQSPEPSAPSPISTPPMNVSAFKIWETSYTTTDNDTFYSSDEPRRIYFLPPSHASPTSLPRKLKRRLSPGMSFPKEGGVVQHDCEACSQTIPSTKDTPGLSSRDQKCRNTQTYIRTKILSTQTFIDLLGYVVDTYPLDIHM